MAKFIHFEEISSTNDYLKENIDNLEDQTTVFSDIQTNGKGRLGRKWEALTGNISMSILFKNQSRDFSLYPLICGIAVSDIIDEICGVETKIKWPNDIILNDKKLCGILCESVINNGRANVICGIGVNVNLKEEDLHRCCLPYATSLFVELDKEFDQVYIAKKIAHRLLEKIKVFNETGFESLKTIYEQKLINIGRQVKVIYDKKTIVVCCLGIDKNGNLVCDYNGEIIKINSGEASVRGLYGYV